LLVLVPLAIGAIVGLAAGGRMTNWLQAPLRWTWVVVAALVVREAIILTPLSRIDWLRYVYVIFLAVLLGWTLWHVRRLPAVWIVSIGAAMNLVVVLANDFRMPVAPDYAGRLAHLEHSGQYVLMDSGTRVFWLGDWIAVPGWVGGVYSPGDMVIAIGIGVVAFLMTAWYRAPSRTKLDETRTGIGSNPP
jgi:hypothetical protein